MIQYQEPTIEVINFAAEAIMESITPESSEFEMP